MAGAKLGAEQAAESLKERAVARLRSAAAVAAGAAAVQIGHC